MLYHTRFVEIERKKAIKKFAIKNSELIEIYLDGILCAIIASTTL